MINARQPIVRTMRIKVKKVAPVVQITLKLVELKALMTYLPLIKLVEESIMLPNAKRKPLAGFNKIGEVAETDSLELKSAISITS